MQWHRLSNGDLLAMAEADGFQVMVTGDQNLSYQQNNLKRIIGLVVLTQTKRKLLIEAQQDILKAIERVLPGSYEMVTVLNNLNSLEQ